MSSIIYLIALRAPTRTALSGNNRAPVLPYAMRSMIPRWFRRLSIGQKFMALFGVVLALLVVSLIAILLHLSRINSYVERHHRITVPALVTAADMRKLTSDIGLAAQSLRMARTARERHVLLERLDRMESDLRHGLDFYRETHAAKTHPVLFRMLIEHGQAKLVDQEETTLTQIAVLLDRLKASREVVPAPPMDGSNDPAPWSALTGQLTDALTALVNIHTRITAEMKREGDALLRQARLAIGALVVLLGLLVIVAYSAASTQIAHPLTELARTADRVARHDLSANFAPWPANDEVGRLAGSLGTMLNTLREQTRSLERKTKELESFTYSVAHDLKGPLREIEGFSTLLVQNDSAVLEPTARHYLAMIRSSTLRLAALIDDLLRYSRLEQQTLPHSVINLRGLIDGVLAEQLRGVTPAPSVHIDLPPCDLRGELTSVRQVFVNLIGNAIKFSRHASPPEISIGGRRAGDELIVWVRDNGIGFDSSESERIFGLFERLHASSDYEGTGVGLAIVKLVMDKHGGRVWAESSPGKGSTFYLAFPPTADGAPPAQGSSAAA
jgi:signal transduction histidine kinase